MKRTTFALGLALACAALAAAQADSVILVRTHGDLGAEDALYAAATVDWYVVEAPADGRVEALVVSVDVQPLLLIDQNGRTDEIAGNRGSARASRRVQAGEQLRVGVSSEYPAMSPWRGSPEYILQVVFGQGDAAVSVGGVVTGALEPGDEEAPDGAYVDWYPMEVTPGSRVRVDVSSPDFDTFLIVELPDGRRLENDDAMGSDSSLGFTPSVAGTARIGVKSYGFGGTGQYELRVTADVEEFIRVGETIEATLHSGASVFTMQGRPGTLVEVTLSSYDFDSVLTIDDPDGTYITNDDYGDSLDSRLLYAFGPSGQATITASSYGGTGLFTLSVYESDVRVTTLEDGYRLYDGDAVTAQLGPGSPTRDGSYYQRLTFIADRGERVEIILRSDSFDSFLRLVDPAGTEVTDDDSAGDLDARIIHTAERSGVHEIYASTLGPGESGLYTLSFMKREPGRVILSTRGQLTPNDRTDITGKVYDLYEFRAEAGRTIVIDVESSSFDALAILRDDSGRVILQDDDGGSNSNARIEFIPDRSARFEIVVTSYSSGAYGNYTVTVYE